MTERMTDSSKALAGFPLIDTSILSYIFFIAAGVRVAYDIAPPRRLRSAGLEGERRLEKQALGTI